MNDSAAPHHFLDLLGIDARDGRLYLWHADAWRFGTPGHTAAFWDDGKAHEQRFIGGTKDPQMTNKQLNHIHDNDPLQCGTPQL